MEITLTLPLDHINAILLALGNAPYVTVAPIIAEIQRQAVPQANAVEPKKPGAKK